MNKCPMWLPRVGGDRPPDLVAGCYDPEAPPRGRGSTHTVVVEVRGDVGSPAWAGIDP